MHAAAVARRPDDARARHYRRARHPLPAFRPSLPFARLLQDESDWILVRAANRVGKTRHAAYKAVRLAEEQPGARIRWVGPSRRQVRSVSARYIWEFARGYLADGCVYNPGTGFTKNNTVVFANGSEIQLLSYQDVPDTHAGDEFDLVIMDEPPTKAHYEENKARIDDREGQIIVLFTAVNRPVQWFREEVEGDEESPSGDDGWTRTEHASGWTQYVIPFRAEYVPWRSKRSVRKRIAKYTGTMAERQRLHGDWEGPVEGRRLASFAAHCLTSNEQIAAFADRGRGFAEIRIGIDHGTGFGKQMAYVVGIERGSVGPTYWLLAEYEGEGNTTPEQDAQGLLDALDRMGLTVWDVRRAYGDIGMGGRHDTSPGGGRWNDKIEEALCLLLGLNRPPWSIEIPYKRRRAGPAGEAAMDHAMAERRFKVNRDECKRFIQSAMAYTGTESKADEALKDPIDAARYAIQDLLLGPKAERVEEWLLG